MEYLLEITRIVDGALKGDQVKVLAYLEQLTRKLRDAGDKRAADRLVRTFAGKGAEVAGGAASVSARLPVDSESRLALADEEWILPDDTTMVLPAAFEERVEEFIKYVKAADLLLESHVGIAPSMLIYGPPGVGKTELARYVAGELQMPLITARSDSLISSFLGSTAKNIRLLFEHVQKRPCILFLDELDSVAKLRDDQHELGELKRVVVSLLQNIDALAGNTVLLAATNHSHLLDPAVWRRFAYRLELGLPDTDCRERLFSVFLARYAPPEAEIRDFAILGEGATGADIRQICQKVIRDAIIDGSLMVESNLVFREVIIQRLGNQATFGDTGVDSVRMVRDLNQKVLTLRRLSQLFNSSEATISRRLNMGDKNGRTRKKTANKSGNSVRKRSQARS